MARGSWTRVLLIVALAATVVGALTSVGQQFLPDALRPLSNSASGWTIPVAASVYLARPALRLAPLLGVLGFTATNLGYAAASNLRGHPYDPGFWLIVGLLAGPLVGGAAALLHHRERRWAAVGAGLLAGILAGEGVYGLTTVADTTGAAYWWAILAIAVVALAAFSARRLVRPPTIAIAAAVLVGTGSAFFVGFRWALPALLG